MTELFITTGEASNVKDFIGPRGISFMPVIGKKREGRPTVVTSEVIAKLEYAFAHSFTDKEACFYADIHPATLYRYEQANPEFSERKEALRLSPNLAAKETLVNGITGNIDQSRWWADRKISDEFASRSKVEHSGKIEGDGVISSTAQKLLVEEFNEKMKATIIAERKAQGEQKTP